MRNFGCAVNVPFLELDANSFHLVCFAPVFSRIEHAACPSWGIDDILYYFGFDRV